MKHHQDQQAYNNVKYIVAIGGSAGALESFQDFIKGLTIDLNVAYVFLQHMDPLQKSLLPELLRNISSLPINTADHGVKIKSNQIYVMQPGTILTIEGSTFLSRPIGSLEERRHPIDIFFKSLAFEYKTQAIGIVMSGTGPDGTNGLRVIRDSGGRTLVQDPNEASFNGMPKSVITAGVADRVLSASEMGNIISSFAGTNYKASSEFENSAELVKVCEVLQQLTGHDFSSYKKSTVARRVERRVQANALSSLSVYIDLLKDDVIEAQALLKDLLISVTQFFRDPEAFVALNELVIPKLFINMQPGEAVRVWIPACATGEEAYSVAILLKEYQRKSGHAGAIQIFATDIDRAALELARAGVYPFTISENVSAEYIERYFLKEENGYRAKQELREACIFSEHSLLRNPPFSRIDLISCRNLFIYWEVELQSKILPVFHYALNADGFLFLGPAESVSVSSEFFKTIEKKYRIFQRNEVASRAHLYFPLSASTNGRVVARAGSQNIIQSFSERDASKSIVSSLLEDFAPPAFVISDQGEIVFYSGKTGKYLEPPTGMPTNIIYDVIRRSIRPELHALVHKCVKTKSEVSYPSLTFEYEGLVQRIKLTVRPLSDQGSNRLLYLVIFQELMLPKTKEEALQEGITLTSTDSIVLQLEGELRETREHLQSTVEEVKSSNEELLSMNEELQSANEELQTSKEELQSTNEELETVNAELSKKVEELDASNGDLQNFFSSAHVPIIFLDRKLRIQRFTPAATLIFRLIPSDIGRGISDINSDLENTHFVKDFAKVLETLQPIEREVSSRDFKFRYIMRVSPYKTLANVIDGVIATFSDVTDLKNVQISLGHSHEQLVDVIESMSDAFFSIDKNWIINQVNTHHEKLTKKKREDQIGKNLIDLFFSAPEWNESIYLQSYKKAMNERVPVYFEDHYPPLDLWTGVNVYPKSDGGLAVFFKDIAQEKRSKMREEGQRQKLEAVFAESPAGMALMRGPTLIFEKVNTRWTELIGAREYIGKTYIEVHPELASSDIPVLLKQVFDTGETYSNKEISVRVEMSPGVLQDKFFNTSFVRVLDGDGRPYGVYCNTLDVTESVLSRKRLEESEKRFQELANSLPQIVWTATPSGVVDYFNQRWYEFTGIERGVDEDKTWADILHPDDLQLRRDTFAHAMKTGEPYGVEYRLKDFKSGTYHWFMGRAIAIKDQQGKIIKWFGSSTDIDQQKRAEVEVRRAKQELHDFLMQAPIGICILSGPTHIYSFVNPEFRSLLFGGRPESDFLGRTVRAVLPELERQGFYEILDEVYLTGKPFIGAKIRASMIQANGIEKELYMNFTYQAKRDQDGRINGILAVIYEVTDQVNEQREFELLADNLRSAILSRDNFLGVASHELNTPLTSLKLQTQMNKRTLEKKGMSAFTEESLSKLLENNLFQAERLSRLITDMLDVSRVSSGKLTVEIVKADFSALVVETLERFLPQLEAAGCELEMDINPMPLVPFDLNRIEQVLVNFITNAVKYAPKNPVHAKVECVGAWAKFSLRDEGKGIALEHQDRIFGRFERATSSNDVSGLGLGLYICKQIINEHSGKIYVESKVGQGATFSFELPLDAPSAI